MVDITGQDKFQHEMESNGGTVYDKERAASAIIVPMTFPAARFARYSFFPF
jgi:hypothetical protein